MQAKRKRPQERSPRPQKRPRKRPTHRQRSEFKLLRVRKMIADGLTKADMDDRRWRYECMREHPGRFCRECKPPKTDEEDDKEAKRDQGREKKLDNDDDNDLDDEQDEEESEWSEWSTDEEAVLSDSWSDHHTASEESDASNDYPYTDDESSEFSLTYSQAWDQEDEPNQVIKFLKDKIAFVDAVAMRLEKIEKPPLVGGLQGRWDLYNQEICPKTWEPTEQYFTLFISKSAVTEPPPPMSHFNHTDNFLESYMEWQIRYAQGGIMPFNLPTTASLEPITITLSNNWKSDGDHSAKITFLGSDCLRLQVPSFLVREKALAAEEGDGMVEFVGIRFTEADIARRKADIERRRRRSSTRSYSGFY